MRILHVVTLHTPDGAFGGPLRVAVNLCAGLAGRGHQTGIATALRGWPCAPQALEGVPLVAGRAITLLPRAGFSGLVSPALTGRLVRAVGRAEVVHVHLARDLVTVPAALLTLLRGRALVLQCHGMVDASRRPLAGVLDRLATRRLLRRADRVLYLTEDERNDLEGVAGVPLPRAQRLINGVPVPEPAPPVGDPGGPPVVLFAARLHSRKQPVLFVQAAARLLARGVRARFVLVGPDEGQLPAVRAAIAAVGRPDGIGYAGSAGHAEVLDWMRRAAVYVLPSVHEPYALSVLESMSVGTPVVVTTSSGLAEEVRRTGAGVVVEVGRPDPAAALAEGIESLLADPLLAERASRAARQAARTRFGQDQVIDRLERIYLEVVADRAAAGASGRP